MNRFKKVNKTIGCWLLVIIVPILVCLGPTWVSHLFYYQDITTIDARYTEFHEALKSKRYETAYQYMSPEYRQTHPLETVLRDDFPYPWEDRLALDPNRYLSVSGNKASLYPKNKWDLLWAGPEYELVKIDGQWYFSGEYKYYLD